MTQETCSDVTSQQWRLEETGLLRHVASAGLCLMVVPEGRSTIRATRLIGDRAAVTRAARGQTQAPPLLLDARGQTEEPSLSLAEPLPSPVGEVYSTVTEVSGYIWHVVTAQGLHAPLALTLHALGVAPSGGPRLQPYWWTGHALTTLPLPPISGAATTALPLLPAADWQVVQQLLLAPELCSGLFLLGETTKLCPVAAARLTRVRVSGSEGTDSVRSGCTATVDLEGAPGEAVTLQFVNGSSTVETVTCTMGVGGGATLSLPSGKCTLP